MRYRYKTVYIDSVGGWSYAEKLKRQGWDILNSSFLTIQFYKVVKS